MKLKAGTPPKDTAYPGILRNAHWWMFCLFIFALKFVLLAIDPSPRFFMGDSGSYLWTALTGWIPGDRSFLYGYVIRWSSVSTQNLNSLVILQVFLSAITAILVTAICRWTFQLRFRLCCLFGFLCALDPLQLLWERYVMTETISLCLYAAVLFVSFFYLQERRIWLLAIIQVLSVLVIGFRISYLLLVQASALLLPLLAFLPEIRATLRKHSPAQSRLSVAKVAGLHLAFSILLMLMLHRGYKQLNGWLAGREPAYLHTSGFSVLATWAPALAPTDSPDPRLAQIIEEGDQFHIKNPRLRNSQLYSAGYLIDRWKKAEPNDIIANDVAKQTAMRALLRRPTGIFTLGVMTFVRYWHFSEIRDQAKTETGTWPEKLAPSLAFHFRLSPPRQTGAKARTVLQRYYLKAQPYYYVVLLSPLACAGLMFFLRKQYFYLLFLHSAILFATLSFLSMTASVRYLQPLSLLTLLVSAALVEALVDRHSRPLLHSAL